MAATGSIDEFWMRHALLLAKRAEQAGEVPVGAVVIDSVTQMLVAEGWNQNITLNDPTAHAEIQALRSAGCHLSNYRFPHLTLYVTLEPCMMCVGALVHARVKHIIFGAYDLKSGALGSQADLSKAIWLNHQVEKVKGGVLQPECAHLLTKFFTVRR